MLDHKKLIKMVKISNAPYENESRRIDSPFKEDSHFFGQVGPNFRGWDGQKLAKMAKNRETYCYANWGVDNSNREYWPLLRSLHYFGFPA